MHEKTLSIAPLVGALLASAASAQLGQTDVPEGTPVAVSAASAPTTPLAGGSSAPAGDPRALPPGVAQRLPGLLTVARVGGGATGVQPLLQPGERAVVQVLMPPASSGQPPAHLDLAVLVSNPPRMVRLPRLPQPGPRGQVRYAGVLPVPQVQDGVQQDHVAFRTTPSHDAETFRDLVTDAASAQALPSQSLGFYDELAMREGRPGPLAGVSGAELFEAGGARFLELRAHMPGGPLVAQGRMALAGRADWMYFSGHYPYTSGAIIGGQNVDPFRVQGQRWGEHLEVLIMAACYAVDVNGPGDSLVNHGRGIHGALWWKKFEGTLLGYRAMAPSNPTDSRIVRTFLERVRAAGGNPRDKVAYSRLLATTWMDVNTSMGQTGAAAFDAAGRHYLVPTDDVNLPGVTRVTGKTYATVERQHWESAHQQQYAEFQRDQQLFQPVRAIMWNEFGGRPPSAELVLGHPVFRQAAQASGLDPSDARIRQKVAAFLDYEAHIFYDVPRPDYYRFATKWLFDRAGRQGQVPTAQDLARHFTPDGSRPGAQMAPPQVLEELVFQEHAWRVASSGVSPAELRQQLGARYQMDARKEAFVRYLEGWLAQVGPQATARGPGSSTGGAAE